MKLPIHKPNIQTPPKLFRRIARQLDRMLSESPDDRGSEIGDDDLKQEISELMNERRFLEGIEFVDGLVSADRKADDDLREIYLSKRRENGYPRALSSARWYEFKTRLGLRAGHLSTYIRASRVMPFDHFIRMESRLLQALEVSERSIDFIVGEIEARRQYLEALREGVFEGPSTPSDKLHEQIAASIKELVNQERVLSREQLAGLVTVTADSTVLFTTRDWSVAGTISTMAGGTCLAMS